MHLLFAFCLSAPGLAAEPDLAAWATRVGRVLPTPDALRAEADGIVLLAPGESLLLQPVQAAATAVATDQALDGVLALQIAPFVEAGLKAPAWEVATCDVAGAPWRCQRGLLELGTGATMRLTAGRQDGADWLAVCLDRKPSEVGPCAPVLVANP